MALRKRRDSSIRRSAAAPKSLFRKRTPRLAVEQMARQRAERLLVEANQTIERLAGMQIVMGALNSALTSHEVAQIVMRHAGEALGAIAASLVLVDEASDELVLLDAFGFPPDLTAAWRRFPHTTDVPVAEAVRTGKPILLETYEQRRVHYPHLTATFDDFHQHKWAALPLIARGHVIGALGLTFAKNRPQSDTALLPAFVQQCAQALERTLLYEAEQRARAVAEAAVKERDQFLTIAIHEFRNPLAIVMGNAQLLERRLTQDKAFTERSRNPLLALIAQAQRLNTLFTALLDVTRVETGQLLLRCEQVDLHALVQRVVDAMQPALMLHTLTYQTPAEPILIEGDPLRLEQVLHNLLQNAVKYSPSGGNIQIALVEEAGHAVITIADQGIGIPEAAIPQIFTRFYRAANVDQHQTSGVGVGLYIVHEIVTQHGGTVAVTSHEGIGSTFIVRLPLVMTR